MMHAAAAPTRLAPQSEHPPATSYAEQLSALEARRRTADLMLLRKMANPREASA